jgi:hypothetical protein
MSITAGLLTDGNSYQQQLGAESTSITGASTNVTGNCYWSSSNPQVASVSNAPGSQGVLTWNYAGSSDLAVTVTATRQGVGAAVGSSSGSTTATLSLSLSAEAQRSQVFIIESAVFPLSVTVFPQNAQFLATRGNQQYTVLQANSDGTVNDVTGQAQLSQSDASGRVRFNPARAGLLQWDGVPSANNGQITVSAVLNTLRNATNVTFLGF